MATKYLDTTGLSHFWDAVKAKVTSSISAKSGLMIPYGYCTSTAGTTNKVVTVSPSITELTTGLAILVRFGYTNTASNPTLNVNGLGAIPLMRYGAVAPSTTAETSWVAGTTFLLVYDETDRWKMVSWHNTTYDSMTDSEITDGTGTTPRLITPARLKSAIQLWAGGSSGSDLPTVTTADNGKVLRVVDGTWQASSLPSASGVSF